MPARRAISSQRASEAAASIGSSPPGPNMRGKCSGLILPSTTLQSVTVSGPPRR
jgi:hypothetical protein